VSPGHFDAVPASSLLLLPRIEVEVVVSYERGTPVHGATIWGPKVVLEGGGEAGVPPVSPGHFDAVPASSPLLLPRIIALRVCTGAPRSQETKPECPLCRQAISMQSMLRLYS